MKTKPKLLITLYAFHPYNNANTNVFFPLIEELKNHYCIDLLTLNKDNLSPSIELVEGINVYRYKNQSAFINLLHSIYYLDINKPGRPFLQKIVLMVGKAISCFLHLFPIFKHPEYNAMKRLLKEKKYDLVLTTCESFLSCYHMALIKQKYHLSCPWISYFMDPFSTYIGNRGCKKYEYQEKKVYQLSDLVLVTEEIYQDNLNNTFSKYLNKTVPVKFMNFNPNYLSSEMWSGFIKGKINCVFAGSFINDAIRNPNYFLKLVDRNFSNDIVFHIICNHLRKEKMNEYKEKTSNSNIFWHVDIPFELCKSIMNNCDVLINFSNNVTNQLPSKVFDYISTGRPIVNFHSIQNDVSAKYLANYPLALNLFEKDDLEKNRCALKSFISNNYKKRLPLEDLKLLYSEYLSKNAVRENVNIINDFFEKKYDKKSN